jgi:O-antigen/teichoic acid export membrane protein
LAYTAADIFMLVIVAYLYRRIYSTTMGGAQSDFRVDPQYRRQSTVTAGTLSTVGLGETWALSFRSTSSDFAFYGLVSRVIDISGLVASYAGYSHLPQLVSEMGDQNWEILFRRLRRVIMFSLIPTGLLAAVVLAVGVTDISIPGYDVAGHWLPLLVLVLSTPAVVLSKYLLQSIANMDPRALVFVSIFTGSAVTFGVIWMYELFGLSGTFLVIAITNVARACWLSLLARRFRSSENYL